jgi:hypothetical protein
VIEAAAALNSNEMRIYRMGRAKVLRFRIVRGEKRVPLSEVKRMRDNPRLFRAPVHRRAS